MASQATVNEADLDIDFDYPRKVAVLPFANRTPAPEAGETVRKLFFNFFSSLNYHDVEPYFVDKTLRERKLLKAVKSGRPPLREICQYLGADALVTGEVTAYGKMFAVLYAHRQVTLKAAMTHCEAGQRIWAKEHTTRDRKGEMSLSLPGIALGVIKTFIGHNQASAIQAAAKLSMDMVATIPNPLELADPPPHIRIMVHNAVGRFLKPGAALKVVLVGDPGMQGAWDPAPGSTGLPLSEKSPGLYVGRYVVQESDRVVDSRPVGRLISPAGAESRWLDVTGGVSFGAGTDLPPVLEGDTTLTAAGSPYFVNHLLLVPPETTLAAEPGAVVWVASGGVVVRGALDLRGTEQAPVRILGSAAEGWKGLLIDRAPAPSTLRHTRIQGAGTGLKTRQCTVTLEESQVVDNGWGVVVDGGSFTMRGGSIHSSKKTGLSVKDAKLAVSASRITDNRGGGVQLKGVQATFIGNDVFGNTPWEVKNLDPAQQLSLPGNWWGVSDPERVPVEGAVHLEPLLDYPAAVGESAL
jgi:hypothetical protein